ncbi:MAG: phosphomannomutase/phosphoglucomutase [Fimbriimonadales bacterium]|nr:phosphomannomutase/phosphoglucomutase [Fimbriimonadales bacterium]
MSERLPCFKAYDVRGVVPTELHAELAYRIGRATADETNARRAVVGYDVRLSSVDLARGLAQGLADAGVDVTNIGLCGTEMVYFATAYYGYGAGIMITASHNPAEYNGMKFVREEARPISGDSGLWNIERRAREQDFQREGKGKIEERDVYDDYVQHLLTVVPPSSLPSLRVLANAGNGCAGLALRRLAPHLPLQITEMLFEPDGSFPHGVPNPLLPENRALTEERMKQGKFDFGVAWDGDYDRCFFFDETGEFIEGYYIVGLLAQDVLTHKPGSTIILDPRLTWNTLEIIERLGGRAVISKTGHAFIKERMRMEDAEYGGEMSAHHYFKSYWFCDSGMIPFLQIARLIGKTGRSLRDMVKEMRAKYPCSGEINLQVRDPFSALRELESAYSEGKIDRIDGLSVEFDSWRFNVRPSNTEPVIRLNVESRGDPDLVQRKVEEILSLLAKHQSPTLT